MMTAKEPSMHCAGIDQWLDKELQCGRLSGGILEVIKDNETFYKRIFGTRDRDQKIDMTEDTVFWIASMTKPIVCATALTFFEQGKLSLEAPLSKYIPAYKKARVLNGKGRGVAVSREATILDLFRHTSGVTYGQFGESELHKAYMDAAVYDFSASNREMAEKLATIPLLHQPGEVFEYGMSHDLLGFVIECIADQDLAECVQQQVTNPLGMSSTGFSPDISKIVKTPSFIGRSMMIPTLQSGPKWFSGGGGLWSTASDYKRFAQMLNGDGACGDICILKPETIALFTQNQLPENVRFGDYTGALEITAPTPENGLGFGLGLAVRDRHHCSPPGFKGEFFWPGVSGTNFWVDPLNQLIVIFMTYSPEHRGQHRIDLRNVVYQSIFGKTCCEIGGGE